MWKVKNLKISVICGWIRGANQIRIRIQDWKIKRIRIRNPTVDTIEDKNVREALPNFDNLLTFSKHTYPVKFSKFLQSLKFWGNKISLAYPLSY